MPERLPTVLATLYLIFNEGYLASSSEALVRTELSSEAIRLARALVAMLPREPEACGLLALMLLTDARRAARVDERGVHAEAASAAETGWPRIVRLYAWLAALAPGPVVELNRAVAVAMSEGPEQGLELIDAIDGLDDYLTLHTARADLLRRLERPREAAGAYRRALELQPNPGERRFIERRLAEG